MDLQLNDKRARVTGSWSGISEVIAKLLAAEGVSAIAHGRRSDEVKRVCSEIATAKGRAAAAVGDQAAEIGADAVAQAALGAFEGVGILVNNADAAPLGDWFDAGAAEIRNVLYDQNVTSVARMVQRVVPGMRERSWGPVMAAETPRSTDCPYFVEKELKPCQDGSSFLRL